VSIVTARATGAGPVAGGADIAWSWLPSGPSTTSQPPARSCSRMESAASKSRARRRSTRRS